MCLFIQYRSKCTPCMPHRCDELVQQLREISPLHWLPQLLCNVPNSHAALTLMSNYFHLINQSPCTGPRPRPRIVCCPRLALALELLLVPDAAAAASPPPLPIRPIDAPRRAALHCTTAIARPSGAPRIPMWPINFAITRSKRPFDMVVAVAVEGSESANVLKG